MEVGEIMRTTGSRRREVKGSSTLLVALTAEVEDKRGLSEGQHWEGIAEVGSAVRRRSEKGSDQQVAGLVARSLNAGNMACGQHQQRGVRLRRSPQTFARIRGISGGELLQQFTALGINAFRSDDLQDGELIASLLRLVVENPLFSQPQLHAAR